MFNGYPVAFLSATLFVAAASLAATPTPPPTPTNLCVNGKCASVAASSAAGGIKWHPGHYVWLDPHTKQAANFSAIDQLSSETSVQGVQVFLNWATLEGDTAGDYSAGFAVVDAYLAKLASLKVPKRLMLGVNERSFGTPPAAGTSCADASDGLLPAYLAASGGCVVAAPGAAGSLAVTAKVWDAAVMDRLIALSQAYAQRYDQNPLFEMFMGNGETALAAPPGSGYTNQAYITQLKRWFDASEKVWLHTQMRFAANYLGSDAQMLDLMTYASANGDVIIGGPDPELPLPNITRTVQTNEIFRAAEGGGKDFRGVVPWIGEVQGLGIGLRYTQTPLEIYTYQSNIMHASYLVWYRNTYLGGAAQMWATGILPFIQSIQGKVYGAECPTGYTQGCNTN